MTFVYCDICDTLVDPDEDCGSSDSDAGVYACDRCCNRWAVTVMGVQPITQRVASFSPETLRFAEQCEKEQESKS